MKVSLYTTVDEFKRSGAEAITDRAVKQHHQQHIQRRIFSAVTATDIPSCEFHKTLHAQKGLQGTFHYFLCVIVTSPVISQNVAIYISSDYIVRQTIIHFIIII